MCHATGYPRAPRVTKLPHAGSAQHAGHRRRRARRRGGNLTHGWPPPEEPQPGRGVDQMPNQDSFDRMWRRVVPRGHEDDLGRRRSSSSHDWRMRAGHQGPPRSGDASTTASSTSCRRRHPHVPCRRRHRPRRNDARQRPNTSGRRSSGRFARELEPAIDVVQTVRFCCGQVAGRRNEKRAPPATTRSAAVHRQAFGMGHGSRERRAAESEERSERQMLVTERVPLELIEQIPAHRDTSGHCRREGPTRRRQALG
jgi:hypothetical protein